MALGEELRITAAEQVIEFGRHGSLGFNKVEIDEGGVGVGATDRDAGAAFVERRVLKGLFEIGVAECEDVRAAEDQALRCDAVPHPPLPKGI